jgi:hypothetical protein
MPKKRKLKNLSSIMIDQVQPLTGTATAKLQNVKFLYSELNQKLKVNPYIAYEQTHIVNQKIQKIEYGLAILEVLLAIRFVFLLFGASFKNILAALTYLTTFFFTIPFHGLFNHAAGFSRSEMETLTAMIVWAGVAWTSIALIRINQKHSMPYLKDFRTLTT